MFRTVLVTAAAVAGFVGMSSTPARAIESVWLSCHIERADHTVFEQVFVYTGETNSASQFNDGYLYKMLNVSIDSTTLHMVGVWSPEHGRSYNLFEIDRRNLSILHTIQDNAGGSIAQGSCQVMQPQPVYRVVF